MSESKSLLIFQYLDEAIDFINQFISANKEYFDKFNPNVLTKLINIESDLVFFVNKFNQKDKDYLSHHGIYIPLLTRSINLGGFYDILANDEVDIANKVDTLKEYIGELSGILQEANQYITIYKNIDERNQAIIQPMLDELEGKIQGVDSALQALHFKETDAIYLGLSQKYKWEYFRNNGYFFITLIIFGGVSWNFNASLKEISNFEKSSLIAFIALKILFISIAITLITLFLRRSSHAKKLQDQAYQTHVEISAFPIHIRSLKDEDKDELVKELALKYFGKKLDQSQNDKIGDLLQDHIRAGTDFVRASAEMVKSVKPSALIDKINKPVDKIND